MKTQGVTKPVRDCLWLIVIALLAYLPGIASLPVIDRDEARYAQATIQMIESGDYIDIRYQDQTRYKKPAGAYWTQAGTLHLTGQTDNIQRGERAIWAHRLPSVIGAVIAVIATYFTGLALFSRREAFAGAALFAVSVSLVFEAHLAKTDALLAGACAVSLFGLTTRRAWPTWLGMAAGLLLKGPVILGVVSLALLTDGLARRSLDRLRPIFKLFPILAALGLCLPWFIAIGLKTEGAFFADALGRDFGSKITSVQETHGGLPGYYLLTGLILFWPGIFAVPFGAVYAWRNRSHPSVLWLMAWLLPMWIVLELTPTKLPHYTLPLYPALALLCGVGWVRAAKGTRTMLIGLGLVAVIGGLLSLILAGSLSSTIDQIKIGTPQLILFAGLSMAVIGLVWALYRGPETDHNIIRIGLFSALFSALAFGAALPRSPLIDLTPRVVEAIPDGQRITSPDYREPSLVYHTGTLTNLYHEPFPPGDTLILSDASPFPACARNQTEVSGVNYAGGETLTLVIFATDDCTPRDIKAWISVIEAEQGLVSRAIKPKTAQP